MSVTSKRTVQVEFSGDIGFSLIQSALDNTVSPAQVTLTTLALGANTITAPVITDIVVTALTIIPPAGNASLITLKGIAGDTGVPIHLTDPTTIGLNTTFVSMVLNAAAEIVGVRLIWS